MRIPVLAFCIYLTVCLAGCSSAIDLPTVTPVAERINTREAQQTGTHSPPAPQVATPTPSRTATSTLVLPTSTPSIPPEARLEIREISLFDTFPKEYQGAGYVVIYQRLEKAVYIIDLATLEKTTIVPQSEYVKKELGILSPDEQWFVRLKNLDVKEPEEKVYEVVSAQGTVQSTFTLPWEWVLRDTWVSNQTILADKKVKPDVQVYQTMAINPVIGQKRSLPFDFPNVYEMFTMHSYDYNVYDPTLNYVVYPEFASLTLRDVAKQRNIVSIMLLHREPVWAPDGSMFAVSDNSSIYGVWLDGTQKFLTHINKYREMSIGYQGERLRWSPDGQKIAFGMSPSPGVEDSHCLAILDVKSEAVTAYCIPGYTIWNHLGSYPIVWSPDGQRLLVEGVQNPRGNTDTHILLFDLEKELAIDLGEKIEPLHFLSSLPSAWTEDIQ